MNQERKTALVTGASRGIGRSIAKELLSAGYSVIGVSRNIDQDDKVMNDLARINDVSYSCLRADIGDQDDQIKIRDFVDNECDWLNVVIHNAGVAPKVRNDVLEMTRESYTRVMNINLAGPVFLTQLLYPSMVKADTGSIIFITSVSAITSSINRAEYCMSKAALSMFSQVMADRLADSSIRVFEVRPGVIETDMTKPVMEKYSKLISEGLIPQARIGQPEDIAGAVRSLLSGDFNYANGMVVEISGGMQIRSLK
ncbi:MAG: 3-ketoacyl-ACP reductase [Bacteroidetes bacterium]|jgi:3-oxoacyl-[acyl-carrier protein] reductase|nr:3-ketoacyl-ACP reductase [Bacteroidota bacterium]MBT3750997.1 3-ketoacyl-ACP reductase [Bacteroidota bacterium]MBT4400304.1 3-ketoacyl-ACP reductase [Bacteroidota bacterium]MBT4408530.1 3-ketoacyl-ACP reductase [Bacteroidota bacterium]MBT5426654.1 3-ketoacyl-ACP reductase [Bacteroidota bacterium]